MGDGGDRQFPDVQLDPLYNAFLYSFPLLPGWLLVLRAIILLNPLVFFHVGNCLASNAHTFFCGNVIDRFGQIPFFTSHTGTTGAGESFGCYSN
jgi:hypothetical protein